jgi:hypothetical protein
MWFVRRRLGMIKLKSYYKVTSSVVTIISLIAILIFSGCAQEKQPPSQTPMPTPQLEEEWSSDGIIKVREYHGSNNYGDYTIHWRSDEQYVYIGMTAKTPGWIAMAVQPGSRMKDADMIFGFVKDGKVEVYDLHSTGNFGPHPLDTELGGTDDILNYNGKEEGGFTTIEFKRSLGTGDQYDIPIQKGVNKIIWAYGSNDSLMVKHSTRGYGEINL